MPGPSWTQGMAQGVENIGDALMRRRQFNQQQNQQDISNAENGVYRGNAPSGSLTVNTPDYSISDMPGGDGPQVVQSGNFGSTNTGSRPLPGGISALNPMTDALMQGRAQSQAQASGGTTTSFSGPNGQGLVDTQRFQQIKTPGGDQFYLDREQTPDAQALRRSVLTGEMGLNRALMVGTLHNAGMLANTDERNEGLKYRTDANNAAYAPGGARYQYNQDAIGTRFANQETRDNTNNGYFDANGKYVIGTKPEGRIVAGAPALQERRAHDRAMEARAGGGGRGSSASDPTVKQFNAVGKQVTQENTAINQTTRQLNSPSTMLDSTATSTLQRQLMDQRRKRDSLMQVGDSLSGVMQHSAPATKGAPPPVAPSANGIEMSGPAASLFQPLPQGSQTPMIGPWVDQHAKVAANTLPSDPTATSGGSYLREAGLYQAAVAKINSNPSFSPETKRANLAALRDRYNQRVASVGKPQQ